VRSLLAKRYGQMVVAAILIIGLFIMSVLVTVYETHSLFLRTRSPVVREAVGAITADFKRALATTLAMATRAYFNYSEFIDFTGKFISQNNAHNFVAARQAALNFLERWRQAIVYTYGEYGVQVSYNLGQLDLSGELGRPRSVYNLMKAYWNYNGSSNQIVSGSYAYAGLNLNLTAMGFYNWTSDIVVGLTLTVYNKSLQLNKGASYLYNNNITINVRRDGYINYSTNPPSLVGDPYDSLISKGWIRIYYNDSNNWKLAKIDDVTYGGLGNYSIRFNMSLSNPTKVKRIIFVVVVSDDRGIIALASTYKSDIPTCQGLPEDLDIPPNAYPPSNSS
jgi:hypothetical protein